MTTETATSDAPATPPDASSALALAPLAVGAEQAAGLVGISERTFWRLLASGCAPRGHKLGARRVWRLDDLRAWASSGFARQTEGGPKT